MTLLEPYFNLFPLYPPTTCHRLSNPPDPSEPFAPEKRKKAAPVGIYRPKGLLLNLYKSSGSTYRIPPEQPQIWFGLIDLLLHNFPSGQGKTSLMATSGSLSGAVS
jgi:hypothetical protein